VAAYAAYSASQLLMQLMQLTLLMQPHSRNVLNDVF